jgi:O-antigen ligase
VLGDLALGALFAGHRAPALAAGLLPLAALGLLAIALEPLVAVLAPFVVGFAYPAPIGLPLPLPGGRNLYVSDIVLAVALCAAACRLLLVGRRERIRLPSTPVLGPIFVVFAALVVEATLRGHERYGQSLLSDPTRIVAYASIGAAMLWLEAGRTYRALVATFYVGAAWQTVVGAYLLATGGSESTLSPISTGGHRVLAGSTSMLLSGSLLFALLEVRRESLARRQALHVAALVVSTVGLALTFQRTTFAAVAVLVPVLLICLRGLTTRVLAALPLAAPFVVVLLLVTPQLAPQVLPMLGRRVSANPGTDASVVWREQANRAVFAQIRESPLIGVGFGRKAVFDFDGQPQTVNQDPHDQYLYLWAGGGLLLLATWVLLMLAFLRDAVARLRAASGPARSLVVWCLGMWFVLCVNVATGVVLVDARNLLIFWTVLLLPAFAVPLRRDDG